MPRQRKSPELTLAMKVRIGRHKHEHPATSYTDIAEIFNVSYDQARRAAMQFASGQLTMAKPRSRKKQRVELLIESQSETELFGTQVKYALGQVAADTNMSALERLAALEKLQKMSLTGHLRRTDAEIIARIIRRFMPEATDMDIIKIYKEEHDQWRNTV